MATVESVVPNSLNYTDIKPQAIENEIKLVRFQPTSTITGAKGGDMIKFLLSGNGFLDPYSTYFQFTVECNDLADGEIRTLDRSAHSFFQRIIIRSQGVELERIENYDMIAAMINDMIYSPEQASLHYWEGFGRHQVQTHNIEADAVAKALLPGQLLHQGSSPAEYGFVGEVTFHNNLVFVADKKIDGLTVDDHIAAAKDSTLKEDLQLDEDSNLVESISRTPMLPGNYYPQIFHGHNQGIRVLNIKTVGNGTNYKPVKKLQFLVPIYSGLLGLLMPEKKLIPLNLLPLDIEIVFNPHALYSNKADGSRNYTITNFNLMSNMVFFEQEIHRTLEASVADHGLFLYCNQFHTAPTQAIGTKALPSVAYISMNLKSINSVHCVFLYNHFETIPCARKLHFVSHNLTKLQLLNGTQLIPQYAIEGNSGSSLAGEHLQYLLELYKAWNKMHDPTTDGSICAYNYCGDEYAGQFDPYDFANATYADHVMQKQGLVGRCQYGISLEGEELGTDKTMITGRKSQYPFLLHIGSSGKTTSRQSYMFTFLRADFIVYIRPDLQIVTLGK